FCVPTTSSRANNPLAGAPSSTPMVCTNDLENLIRTLQDQNVRDDTKLQALKEFWESFDSFSSLSTFSGLLDALVRSFLKLFAETSAQFIAENNTQQLRKLMLDILLRTTGHDVMKLQSRPIQLLMIKIIQTDNEVNAGLAIHILIDHIKLARPLEQMSGLMAFLRKCFFDMDMHVRSGRIYEKQALNTTGLSGHVGEDLIIEMSLQRCFTPHGLSLGAKQTGGIVFKLIPRGSQSVTVLGESIHLIMLICQQNRQQGNGEARELIQAFVLFTNAIVDVDRMPTEKANQELLNEIHSAQVKTLIFFSWAIRSCPAGKSTYMTEALVKSADGVCSATLFLLDSCPNLVVSQRKDLLRATKTFFSCDQMRGSFVPHIPRLFSEKLMLGTEFTANDYLRKTMYEQLAELLQHLRTDLSYPVLCHAMYIFSRCLHDPLLPPSTQIQSIRAMMTLCDSFIRCERGAEKAHQPARDIFLGALESLIAKLRVLVVYHLPLLFATAGEVFRGMEWPDREMDPVEKQKLIDIIAKERRHSYSTPANPSALNLDDPSLHCHVEGVP
ncbi:hypothetical protein PENTCL1PPCAC_25515, partial [Pristionchus entomophagus]